MSCRLGRASSSDRRGSPGARAPGCVRRSRSTNRSHCRGTMAVRLSRVALALVLVHQSPQLLKLAKELVGNVVAERLTDVAHQLERRTARATVQESHDLGVGRAALAGDSTNAVLAEHLLAAFGNGFGVVSHGAHEAKRPSGAASMSRPAIRCCEFVNRFGTWQN